MGYFEHLCQLCAVSFAIARFRTSTEPPEAAWAYYGRGFIYCDGEQDVDEYCHPCSETGCSTLPRDNKHEHLSGPGCTSSRGYSGANISLAEMKGCRAMRAILKKSADLEHNFEPEDDDEAWERETRYYFTGTGDGSPDESPLNEFDRVRHGAWSVFVNNQIYDDEEFTGMPIHPYCWEVFKHVSTHVCHAVDIHGLWKFRTLNNESEDFHETFPRHPSVRSGYEQWWKHERGCEWIAANPVDVPGFSERLETYQKPMKSVSDTTPFDVNTDVFRRGALGGGGVPVPPPASDDPFAKLPAELRLMTQELLPSSSIAALRLASRAMQPVPTIAFRRLLFEDLPWVWEARDLHPASTDWFGLYRDAKLRWTDEFKGIKNRVRIWGEVAEICRRVNVYREEGKIRGVTGWEDDADDEE